MQFGFVNDRIAVGQHIDSLTAAWDLRKAGITHVLNTHTECSRMFVEAAAMAYLHNGTPDGLNSRPKPASWFQASIEWALHVLAAEPRHKLYVHCAGGIDRSTSTVYAILMALGASAAEAEVLIRYKWPRAGLYYKTCAEIAVKELGYKP